MKLSFTVGAVKKFHRFIHKLRLYLLNLFLDQQAKGNLPKKSYFFEYRSDYFKGARLFILPMFSMSEIIDRVVLGSCRFTGTNPERGAPGHLVLGGVLHQVHAQPHKVSEEEIISLLP